MQRSTYERPAAGPTVSQRRGNIERFDDQVDGRTGAICRDAWFGAIGRDASVGAIGRVARFDLPLMRIADKAERITAILDELYPDVPIPLAHVDPFTLLVAVVLSAQTTDKKVNEVTPGLFARGGTPEAMAALPVEEIQELIRQVGLAPQKSRAICGLANRIVAEHGGTVPDTFDALEALPGVGHKTASVVMSQAFGHPAFAVDTHIHRLAHRWGLSDGTNVVKTERDLKKVFPRDSWNRLHLQIIYFGREYCPARYHGMESCPICAWAATKKFKAWNAAGR